MTVHVDPTVIRVLSTVHEPHATTIEEALSKVQDCEFELRRVRLKDLDLDDPALDVEVCLIDIADLDLDRLSALPSPVPLIAVGEQRALPKLAELRSLGFDERLTIEDLSDRSLGRSVRHVVERAASATALREAKARHALLLRAASDGLWEWDLRDGQVSYSDRWKQMFGFSDTHDMRSRDSWFSQVHDEDLAGLRADIREHIDGGNAIHQCEHRIRQRDGSFRWVFSRGLVRRDRWGRAIALAGSLTDINRRKQSEIKATLDRMEDELTGLPSRHMLHERISTAIDNRRKDPANRFAVLFLNLDRFKVLNDSIGLESADQILIQLAGRLQRSVGDGALLCRYGGDEFALLIESIDTFDASDSMAADIHECLRAPFELDGQTIFTTAAIGIANSDRDYDRPAEVIRDAGLATSRAKRQGKSKSSTFDTAMRQEALATLRTQMQLREAILRQQFEVYYQPIVALGSCKLTGFEALVRWNHPKRGIVGPVEFIPLAEETGLIIPIGQFVLRQACTQMATWHRRYPDARDVSISINLSGHQLSSPTLVADIEQVLTDTGLNPCFIKIELTESTLIDDPKNAQRILDRLRDRGMQLYIDDFGTGYSSLSYLHRFSIDGLKIDKSFVDMVGLDERKAAIVPSIVGLAHSLGMGIVAEGVETQAQARALTLMDCAEAQGYLYSRPVPRDEAAKLIERRILSYEPLEGL